MHHERYSLSVYKVHLYREQGTVLDSVDAAEAFTLDPAHRIQKLSLH